MYPSFKAKWSTLCFTDFPMIKPEVSMVAKRDYFSPEMLVRTLEMNDYLSNIIFVKLSKLHYY